MAAFSSIKGIDQGSEKLIQRTERLRNMTPKLTRLPGELTVSLECFFIADLY